MSFCIDENFYHLRNTASLSFFILSNWIYIEFNRDVTRSWI